MKNLSKEMILMSEDVITKGDTFDSLFVTCEVINVKLS